MVSVWSFEHVFGEGIEEKGKEGKGRKFATTGALEETGTYAKALKSCVENDGSIKEESVIKHRKRTICYPDCLGRCFIKVRNKCMICPAHMRLVDSLPQLLV